MTKASRWTIAAAALFALAVGGSGRASAQLASKDRGSARRHRSVHVPAATRNLRLGQLDLHQRPFGIRQLVWQPLLRRRRVGHGLRDGSGAHGARRESWNR